LENRVYYGQYSLKHWIDLILKKNIILPEYQRYFVWNEKKAETLIETFKNNQFIPPVTIGAFTLENSKQNLVLDGQQRLTSILLAYLGLYPDAATYYKVLERFKDENDSEYDDDDDRLDNILAWTFKELTEKGSRKQEILEKIYEGNYKKIDFKVDDSFFENKFLGFSYLVPSIANEKQQQRYYSSVFRNINIQGETLLAQESRASLYFLDKDLTQFFSPSFINNYAIKGSGESKIDFVRYLSLLSQYNTDNGVGSVARGYKQRMEKYYEEYIYSVVDDQNSKYGKFSTTFPSRKYDERFSNMQDALASIEIPKTFNSIIDLDLYFFGLTYVTILLNKKIDAARKETMKQEIETAIQQLKKDAAHIKAPSHLKYLRMRITSSITICEKYAA
jgi:uncharacterized protein with ParB-like and HNH nuclease domain